MAIPPTECHLCPRECGALRSAGQRGVCGVAGEIRVARAALHLWEEPCICTRAGSGAIFFCGCPLHCVYCQNADISSGDVGQVVGIEDVATAMLDLQSQDACNINLVTPTQYADSLVEAVAIARARGLEIPVVWNTGGYERVETIASLSRTVDVYLTDFKYADSATAARYSNASDYPRVARAALEAMVNQTGVPVYEGDSLVRGVIVRHLLLPGLLEESKSVVRFVWEAYGSDVVLSLMNQYTPVGLHPGMPELDELVSNENYERLLDFADELGIPEYCWQQGGAVGESFIPAWDGTGISH